jgi:hypothetical protein
MRVFQKRKLLRVSFCEGGDLSVAEINDMEEEDEDAIELSMVLVLWVLCCVVAMAGRSNCGGGGDRFCVVF